VRRARCAPARRLLVCCVALLCALVAGCHRLQSPSAAATSERHAAPPSYSLTIYGYNYTDTEIGSFEVDGHGGGNVPVSTTEAGGGSGVCCATAYSSQRAHHTITIKWTRDNVKWCEAEVTIDPNWPAKPEYLEVHFYQDGHIEAAVTEDSSPPRLKLQRLHGNSRHQDPAQNVVNDDKFGKCRRGYY
jgi:hypothetical protein